MLRFALDRPEPDFRPTPGGPGEDDSETPTEYSPAGPGGAPGSRDEGPLETGQKCGRYHIIKLLGLGGMGAVYRAWDEELGVAVKIVRPEIAKDPEAARDLEKRFKRELLLAWQVTHPNVVCIHDMGEIGGIKYITMPYVDGDELASILKKNERGLPIEQVMAVARGVVSGLVAAYQAGVVHRDLKPANMMVETGTDQAMIMHFGIARSAGAGDSAGTPGAKIEPLPGGSAVVADPAADAGFGARDDLGGLPLRGRAAGEPARS